MKFTAKVLLILPFIFLGVKVNLLAQGGVSYVITNNASINIDCDSWIVDADSMRGNYPVGNQVMTISTAVGNKLGIQLDSFHLREDDDYINIYDGPSTSSPLLTSLQRSCLPLCPLFDDAVTSSGNVVTIFFHGQGPGGATNYAGWRLRIKCLQDITQTADFLPIFQYQGLNSILPATGNIRLNDYDKDGDKDVLMGGVILRNDSYDDSLYLFDRLVKPIGNWRHCDMVTADFDNDGWKDIFITGETDPTGLFTQRSMIFRNVNGVFTALSTSMFAAASYGTTAVVDYNNDGKMDISYSGFAGNGNYVFKVYLNNGNFNFTEQPVNLPGFIYASMAWKDYDNDGDQDLLYNGYRAGEQETGLFINNNNSFTKAGLDMFNTYSGEIRWVDVNKDGKYDIVNSGIYNGGGIHPEILFNNGNNTFSRVITNLPNIESSHYDWADYDNDGDMDIVLTGIHITSSGGLLDAQVYKNNGNGNFITIAIGTISSTATPKWVDFNKDGKLDVFVPGRGTQPSYFFKNMGGDIFSVSSYPLTAFETEGKPLVEDFNNDGFVDILFAGELNDQNCEEGSRSVLIRGLGWRLTPVVKLTRIVDLNESFTSSTPYLERYWRWGDINSDGLDDIIENDDQDNPNLPDSMRVFKNNGNGTFTKIWGGYLSASQQAQAGVVDINNDGINELYAPPNALYRWNGAGFTLLYSDLNGYCSSDGCRRIYFEFADFNNDGLMDVAYTATGTLRLLKNNGSSRFDFYQGLGIGDQKYLKWADYDNDGDLDLLTSRQYFTNMSTIYENTSWGGFRSRDQDIAPHLHTAVADFNGDGWPDIAALQYRTEIGPAKLYYQQQGKLFFQDKTPDGFITINNGVTHEGIETFDIDNDGDNDIIYSTNSYPCSMSGVYLNHASSNATNIFVRSPNGSENYLIGSTQTIRWMGNNIGTSVKIEVSLDSGATWTPLIASTASSKYGGEYQWNTTGATASTKYLVRITDNTNNAITDKSDRTFTLSVATAVNNPVIIQNIRIFPNPVHADFFNLETRSNLSGKKGLIQIFNLNGTLVETKNFIAQSGIRQIDLKSISSGVYLVKISFGKETATYKLIKL